MKEIIKKLVRKWLLAKGRKIVIASNGRAGSTLLFHAIGCAYLASLLRISPASIFAKKLAGVVSGYCERFDCIENFGGGVVKTHALWRQNELKNTRFIFIHGDPLDSAVSVENVVNKHGLWWFEKHLYHLESPGGKFSDIYLADVLNYEAQIESWANAFDDRVLCLAYEDLWSNIDVISRHVGFQVILPAHKERSSNARVIEHDARLFEALREKRRCLFGG